MNLWKIVLMAIVVCQAQLYGQKKSSVNHLVVTPDLSEIPANILRFHLKFPDEVIPDLMRQGVEIVDESGQTGQEFFLHTPQELWNPDCMTLTQYLNPAKVKTTLSAYRLQGAHFVPGKFYRIRVLPLYRNSSGRLIHSGLYERSFKVIDPQKKPLNPTRWKLSVYQKRSKPVFDLNFDIPMDDRSAQAWISVIKNGTPVAGSASVSRSGYTWRFRGGEPLEEGTYQVIVSDQLEDIAGNRISGSFEWNSGRSDFPPFYIIKSFRYSASASGPEGFPING